MTEQETQKRISQLENDVRSLRSALDKFLLHSHNGLDSTKIKIADLDTVIYREATINPASLVDGAGETHQVTGVTGATLGDFVVVSAPYDLQDITVTAYVQANDTVEIRIQNESGATVDLASGKWRILVIKKLIQ